MPSPKIDQPAEWLKPVSSFDPDGYHQLALRLLVPHRNPELWMVTFPSFFPESAISLEANQDNNQPSRVVDYTLRLRECAEPIWNYKDLGNGTSVLDLRHNPKVVEHVAPFPAEAAILIRDAWQHVLKQSRFPEHSRRGCDGVIYDFYANYGLSGTTWCPEGKPASEMVECGELLVKYVLTPADGRPAILQECIVSAKSLQCIPSPSGTMRPQMQGSNLLVVGGACFLVGALASYLLLRARRCQ